MEELKTNSSVASILGFVYSSFSSKIEPKQNLNFAEIYNVEFIKRDLTNILINSEIQNSLVGFETNYWLLSKNPKKRLETIIIFILLNFIYKNKRLFVLPSVLDKLNKELTITSTDSISFELDNIVYSSFKTNTFVTIRLYRSNETFTFVKKFLAYVKKINNKLRKKNVKNKRTNLQ